MTTLVITRPAREAGPWLEALRAAGWSAVSLPLIEIGPAPDAQTLVRGRTSLASCDAVMFVSAQAVTCFFGDAAPACGPELRYWAPGPGTARVLREQGVPAAQIDAPAPDAEQFDSEALWAVVQGQVRPGHRLLIVRGQTGSRGEDTPNGHGRDWLARQCEAAGGTVDWCVAYQRHAPHWDVAQRAQVHQWQGGGAVWLCSSSEALQNLAVLCPQADWSRARALVTHPRIEQVARQLGFGEIITSRPALADVLHSLESLH